VRRERDTEEISELAIEVHGARLRVLDGPDDDIAHGLETFVQEAQGDALAGAGIACDHDVAAVGDAVLDAPEECVEGGGGEEGLDGDVGAERVEFQAVEGLQLAHGSESSSSGSGWASCLGR
jgi:hypothetical protein